MLTSNITNTSPYAVKAKVELFVGSTLVHTCFCEDILQSFSLDRSCDMSKFFGYGYFQKMNIKVINDLKEFPVSTENNIKVAVGDGVQFDYPFPTLHVTEVHKDEIENISSITCYDALHRLKGNILADLELNAPYTIRDVAQAVANLLGVPLVIQNVNDTSFDTYYEKGANYSLEKTELLRDVLDDIAEVTQTIYFMNNRDELVFKRLDRDGQAVLTITKDDYYSLETKTNRRLAGICKTTELGDNVGDQITQIGTTQFIRDNPFWDLRSDIGTLVENALAAMGGLTLNQFHLDWDGNYLLELGDKIDIVSHDDTIVTAYYLDDTITYAGFIEAKTEWEYTASEPETESNPANLGDKLNQTFAKVDKLNKTITLVAQEIGDTTSDIAELKVTTDSINLKVEEIISGDSNDITSELLEAVGKEIDNLTKEVNLKVSADDVTIAVTKTLNEGVEKVVTASKKYTFDDTGLKVGSSENSISTTISEDGMRIYRHNEEVLTADNQGVKAEDLHATTYLIIGENSRFEDWQDKYTACFWIGED